MRVLLFPTLGMISAFTYHSMLPHMIAFVIECCGKDTFYSAHVLCLQLMTVKRLLGFAIEYWFLLSETVVSESQC